MSKIPHLEGSMPERVNELDIHYVQLPGRRLDKESAASGAVLDSVETGQDVHGWACLRADRAGHYRKTLPASRQRQSDRVRGRPYETEAKRESEERKGGRDSGEGGGEKVSGYETVRV
eukprot:768540-Hanusia_phi.AAC.7